MECCSLVIASFKNGWTDLAHFLKESLYQSKLLRFLVMEKLKNVRFGPTDGLNNIEPKL